MHITDLIGLEEDDIDPRMARHPGMRLPLQHKLALLEQILTEIAGTHEVVPYADALGRANGTTNRLEAA